MADAPNLDLSRLVERRSFLRGALAAAAGGAALALGCGSDENTAATPTSISGATSAPSPTAMARPTAMPSAATTANPRGISPVILTSEFVAGRDNRFVVGLLDGSGKLVVDASVDLRFFQIGADGTTGTLRGEGNAAFAQLNIEGAHLHDGTTGEASTDDVVSFYVAHGVFEEAGKWGAQVIVTPDNGGPPSQIQAAFDVVSRTKTKDLGEAAPATQNDTQFTNPDVRSLCSRSPICGLHDKVIGDIVGKGRPAVIQFSTPAFCETRFCGPVLEVLLSMVPVFRDVMDFVHIEVWQDFQLQKYRPAVSEWGLTSEPWTFLVDKAGTVVLKIESIFAEEEIGSALQQLAAQA